MPKLSSLITSANQIDISSKKKKITASEDRKII